MRPRLQKLNTILRSELLINKLEDESKKNPMKNLRHSSTASEDAIDKKGKTSKRIAEMTGTT